jgi:Fe-S cluster assembly iron-binding protein IscA
MIVAINKSHNINYKAKIDFVTEDIASFFLPKNPWLKTPSFIVFCPQQLSFVQCVPKIW